MGLFIAVSKFEADSQFSLSSRDYVDFGGFTGPAGRPGFTQSIKKGILLAQLATFLYS